MNSKLVKASSALTLVVLIASVAASNAPAFAINGHGISFGPTFGGDPLKTYNDGLKINGVSFDISKYTTTINTQTLYVGSPSDITVKMYQVNHGKTIQHAIIFLDLHGNDPQSSYSKTRIEWDSKTGASVADPNGIFKSVTATVKYDGQITYLTFHITPAKSMDTTHMMIRAWDMNLKSGQVVVQNAIKISYTPQGFSSVKQ